MFGVHIHEIVPKRRGDHIKMIYYMHGAKAHDDMGPCSLDVETKKFITYKQSYLSSVQNENLTPLDICGKFISIDYKYTNSKYV